MNILAYGKIQLNNEYLVEIDGELIVDKIEQL
jgi:hypothetical protein